MANNSRSIYSGRALRLNEETAVYPDGRQGTLEIIRHPGGAAVLALDEDSRVCLIRHYRHAAGGWLWEIPAGRLEPSEPPLATARRELAEEAGLEAGEWRSLGSLLPSPGICDEQIHLFLARQFTPVPLAHEADEYIEIHWLPFAEAVKWAVAGKITDAKTLVALLRAQCSSEVNPHTDEQ